MLYYKSSEKKNFFFDNIEIVFFIFVRDFWINLQEINLLRLRIVCKLFDLSICRQFKVPSISILLIFLSKFRHSTKKYYYKTQG